MNPSVINFLTKEDLIEVNECCELLGYEYDSESARELTKEQLLKDQKKAVDQVGHQVYVDVCMGMLQATQPLVRITT